MTLLVLLRRVKSAGREYALTDEGKISEVSGTT